MLSKTDLDNVLDGELAAALDLDRSLDNGTRQMAVDYYTGTLPTNDSAPTKKDGQQPLPDPNRSAVSLDVADMVEAVSAQLLPALEAPGAIEFEASGPDDEQQAQRESAIVRSIIMEGRNADGGFVALTEAAKDALMMRTGVLALWVQKRETITPEEWEAVPEIAVGQILQPTAEGQRVQRVSVQEDEDSERAAEAEQKLYRVTLERVDVDKRLVMAAIPREDYVTSDANTRDANETRFCADRMVMTRAEWVSEGLPEKEIADLPAYVQTGEDGYIERNRSTGWTDDRAASQKATDNVELWRCYPVLGDTMTSATGRRYRVFYSKQARRSVGKPEKVGRVCYALGVATIFPHRLEGVSLVDSIAETQELKSKALRNWNENLHRVNRARIVVDETLTNLDDALDATVDVVRVRGPGAVNAMPSVDAGPSIMGFLQYCDQQRSERGGASLDMQSQAGLQIATNQTASGIERQYSSKETRAAMMARTFAETAMRQVWLAAHYLLRTQWGGPIAAKISGEWVQSDPTKWNSRTGVVVHVGESRTQAAMRAAALQQVGTIQATLLASGKAGILTDDSRAYNALTDWCYAANLRAPERYFVDPNSQSAQQAAQQQQQQAQQAQQAQMAMARAAMMLEKYKTDTKALTDLIKVTVDAAIEEAKLTLQPDPLEEAQLLAGTAAGQARADKSQAEEAAEPGEAGERGE